MIDPKAKKILLNTYWSSSGWKSEMQTDPDELAYAKKMGLMFDDRTCDHDGLQDWMFSGLKKTEQARVTEGFVSSLGSRRLDLRSALSSFTFAANFPRHKFNNHSRTLKTCGVCGTYIDSTPKNIDLNILNFERLKWGGVRLTHPEYVAFDLHQFADTEFQAPIRDNYRILAQILETADNLGSNATPNNLERALAGKFKSNKDERRIWIDILGVCGVFSAVSKTGFFNEFTLCTQRDLPAHSKNDWNYPTCWWSGADGVNWEVAAHLFPEL